MGGTVGFNAWARAVHHRNCSLIWGLVPVILQSFIQPADQQTLSLVGFGPNTARRPVHNFTPPSCLDTNNFSKLPLDIPSQNMRPNSPPFPPNPLKNELKVTNLEVGMVAICEGRVHLVHGHGVHAGHLVLLLPLHPTVLEPDLDLPLGQAQSVRYLDPEFVQFGFLPNFFNF